MKNIKSILFLFCCTALFSACNKELNIDFPDAENQLVVNALINDQEPVTIEISKSLKPGFGPLENAQIVEVETATVELFENNNLVETLSYAKQAGDVLGKYRSSITPKTDHSYSIKVTDPASDLIEASTSIPQPPAVRGVSADTVSTQWEHTRNLVFTFTIDDPEDENYYYFYLDVPIMVIQNSGDTVLYDYYSPLIDLDDQTNKSLYLKDGFIFSDVDFNGTPHIITGAGGVRLRNEMLIEEGLEGYVDIANARLRCYSLTKETYQFFISHSLYLTNQYELYAEPVNVFSNIENGLGVFGGAALVDITIPLN